MIRRIAFGYRWKIEVEFELSEGHLESIIAMRIAADVNKDGIVQKPVNELAYVK